MHGRALLGLKISMVTLDVQDFQSKELPNSRIQPDRRWFGNTRVIGQKQLETFREEMSSKVGAMAWLLPKIVGSDACKSGLNLFHVSSP